MVETSPTQPPPGKNPYLAVIAGLLIVLMGVYIWKMYAVSSLEREQEETLARETAELLRLAAVPLGWSIRTELLQEDLDQIRDYLNRLVKEPSVTRIALVDPEGTILVSTDRKLEGQPASTAFDPALLEVQEVRVEEAGELEFLVSVPVMGYDARLGTLLLTYSRGTTGE